MGAGKEKSRHQMNAFHLELDKRAQQDLIDHALYFETNAPGVGEKYLDAVAAHLKILAEIPYQRLRYEQIRCVPVLKYPFMIHYSVLTDRMILRVHSIIHTSMNPDQNWNRKDWVVSEQEALYGLFKYDLELEFTA
jgi:plasmid stabilization system protein ParE